MIGVYLEVFEAMIKSGEKYAKESGSKSPLMYQWHDSEYLGAAHGVSGIIYLLLKVWYEGFFSDGKRKTCALGSTRWFIGKSSIVYWFPSHTHCGIFENETITKWKLSIIQW